jgi:D-arginine dehydrogenase
MSEACDILIVGGGISGVSLAARLAPHARVALAEAEEHLGTQATGRSAALLVEAYERPEMRRLTTRSRAFFETPPKGFSDTPLSGRRGVMVYGGADDLPKLREEFELAARTTTVRWCDAEAVAKHCPLLKPDVAAAGFLEPNALQLDANALLQGFARTARADGAELHTAAPVRSIARRVEGWEVQAGSRAIFCAILVNAAGAWVDEVAALSGVARRGLGPMRTAATLPVPEEIARMLPTHPFATPIDGSFYFKPETGSIMVSLSEETLSEPCDAYPEELDVAVALERFHAATIVPRARPSATWAGLRTFAADRLPVVGFDPDAEGFFWYAGQGGTGIQTSPAHSALAAKLILHQELDAAESDIAAAFRCDRRLPAWP